MLRIVRYLLEWLLELGTPQRDTSAAMAVVRLRSLGGGRGQVRSIERARDAKIVDGTRKEKGHGEGWCILRIPHPTFENALCPQFGPFSTTYLSHLSRYEKAPED